MTNLHETDRLVVNQKALKAAIEAMASFASYDTPSTLAEDCIRAYLDALTAMGGKAEPVKVKPLEWRSDYSDKSGYENHDARTILGMYEVWRMKPDQVACLRVPGQDPNERRPFETPEDAMAVAQADFDARILSALASPASPVQARGEGTLDPATIEACAKVILSRIAGMSGQDAFLRAIVSEIRALSSNESNRQ